MKLRILTLLLPLLLAAPLRAQNTAEIKSPAISGGVTDGKVRLVIEGLMGGQPGDKEKLIVSTALQESIRITRDKLTQNFAITFDILQG
jgi:hypothetical protein